jgi:hypothetical protein
MKQIRDFRQNYVNKGGRIHSAAGRLPNNEGNEIAVTDCRPASQGHNMDPRHTIPFFIVWVLVLAALCVGFSYDSSSATYSGPLLFCILVFRNKESYARKMSTKSKWISIGIAVIIIALIMWGAVSGYNSASSKEFNISPYRPYVGLGLFVLYFYAGYTLFQGLRKLRMNSGSSIKPF